MATDPKKEAGLWTVQAVMLWASVCVVLTTLIVLFLRINALFTQDFRAFYAAGQIVRHQPSLLFDPDAQRAWQSRTAVPGFLLRFYHPAYEALLYAVFSFFRYQTAYLLYAVWNMLLLFACYLVAPMPKGGFASRFPRHVLFFLSFPLLLCIFVGQNSLLFFLILSFAYRCFEKRSDRALGALLGLAVFKLPIVVILAALLTMRRGSRFVQGFVLAAAAVLLISVWITGLSGTQEFLHLLGAATLAGDHSVQAQSSAAVWLRAMPNLAGFLYICLTRYLSAKAAFVVNAGVSAVIFAGCAYIVRRSAQGTTAFSAALIAAVFLSPHLYIYDFSVLLIPILVLKHRWMPLLAAFWFVEPPVLYGIGFLRWFSPAAVLPIVLLGMCMAEFRREVRQSTPAAALEAKLA